jgi:hypothetical protein
MGTQTDVLLNLLTVDVHRERDDQPLSALH